MAHKILVLSPLHNMGTTVVSSIVAQAMTFDNKTSTLLFTQQRSPLPKYLDVSEIDDPTRSVMQIMRLIDNGAIEDKDILDYAFNYTKNGWIVNVADPTLSGADREQVITHIFRRVPTDIVVCDCSEDLDSPVTESLIELADMIFIVTDMSEKSTDRLTHWLKSEYFEHHEHTYIIVNKYDEVVWSVRNYAKYIKSSANKVCKVHYNPWITKCTLNSQLNTLLPMVRDLDPRVAHLNSDVNEIIQCINGDLMTKWKKGF